MFEWYGEALRNIEGIHFWPVLVACALVAAGSLGRGIGYWRSSRLLEDIPASRTRSAAQGYVQLVGEIQDEPHFPVSPLGQQRVAWWSLTVQAMPHGHRKAAGFVVAWVILALFFRRFAITRFEESRNRFRIRDEHGECEVEPQEATVVTANEEVIHGSVREEISAADRVSGKGESRPQLRFVKANWSESEERHIYRWLSPGERVYVLGEFASTHEFGESQPLSYTALRTHSERILEQWRAQPDRLMARFDEDGDRKLDGREWTAIRRAAMTEARIRLKAPERSRVLHRLGKPSSGAEFLIVSLDDPALGPALRRRALGWLLLFFALGALTVHALNLRLLEMT